MNYFNNFIDIWIIYEEILQKRNIITYINCTYNNYSVELLVILSI